MKGCLERNFCPEMKSSLQNSAEGDNGERRRPARSAGAVQGALGQEPRLTVTDEQMLSTNLCWIHSAKVSVQSRCASDALQALHPPVPTARWTPKAYRAWRRSTGPEKGGERRKCKERAAEVARDGDVRASRLPEQTHPPTAHLSAPHAPLSK